MITILGLLLNFHDNNFLEIFFYQNRVFILRDGRRSRYQYIM